MIDEAARLVPERVPVALEELRALRWLAVPAPTDITVEARYDGAGKVAVVVEGYAQAVVVVAPSYPVAPPDAPIQLAAPRPSQVDGEALYRDRWMFHGPAFQGVRTITCVGDDGITGELETGAAPGALLDNAGQLLGHWVMVRSDSNRLAMPIGIGRMALYGPHPAPGARVRCDVRITTFDARQVAGDIVLSSGGKTWCVISGWQDRRFDTDARLWDVLLWPERSCLSAPLEPGDHVPVVFDDTYGMAPTREQLMRRYLGERERAVLESTPPRSQRAHLDGRIAAKDALRQLCWRRDPAELFPAEFQLQSAASGQPLVVRSPERHGGLDFRISIAHKGEVAVALAALGRAVGVDVERIEPRPASFDSAAFVATELALILPADDGDEWRTRLWAAKEAAGKLLGDGLGGTPHNRRITDRTGERLLCEGHWVETRRRGEHVIAWCLDDLDATANPGRDV
jgi:phosphopantetheinyl transferase